MNKILALLVTLIIALTSTDQPNHTCGGLVKKGGAFAKALGDDDPILMRAHVRTTGGGAIAGAAVTLTPDGASTPLYSGTTDSHGDYTWDQVNQGGYTYRITKTGYVSKNFHLDLTSNTERTDTLVAE